MQVTLAAVMSLDARITRHEEADINTWVSDEDQAFFYPLLASHEVIIMGRKTYDAVKSHLRLDQKVKRIVLTRNPKKYYTQAVEKRLQFINQSMSELLQSLQKEGVQNILIVGGPRLFSNALRNKLVDILYITVEPRLFGSGVSLMGEVPMNIHLALVEAKVLNTQGTMLLKYTVTDNLLNKI